MNDVSASVLQPTTIDLVSLLSRRVVGQSAATKAIVPYVYMYQSGLAPEGRPAGIFLLLGPSGTGNTKTVEAVRGENGVLLRFKAVKLNG
jgi:ATP-dependent Clp protease ATP-binding subunit ClpA